MKNILTKDEESAVAGVALMATFPKTWLAVMSSLVIALYLSLKSHETSDGEHTETYSISGISAYRALEYDTKSELNYWVSLPDTREGGVQIGKSLDYIKLPRAISDEEVYVWHTQDIKIYRDTPIDSPPTLEINYFKKGEWTRAKSIILHLQEDTVIRVE